MRCTGLVGNQHRSYVVHSLQRSKKRRTVILKMGHRSVQANRMGEPCIADTHKTTGQPLVYEQFELRSKGCKPRITVDCSAKGLNIGNTHAFNLGMMGKIDPYPDDPGIQPLSGTNRLDKNAADLVAIDQNIVRPFAPCGRQTWSKTGQGLCNRQARDQRDLRRIGLIAVGLENNGRVGVSRRRDEVLASASPTRQLLDRADNGPVARALLCQIQGLIVGACDASKIDQMKRRREFDGHYCSIACTEWSGAGTSDRAATAALSSRGAE